MFENKKIFILGMARSGYEAAKLLSKHGNAILITDKKEQKEEHVKELTGLGVDIKIKWSKQFKWQKQYLIGRFN